MECENTNKYEFNKDGPYNSFKVASYGVRHGQCILLFFTFTVAYSIRACMGVALVAMVYHAPVSHHSTSNETVFALNVNHTLANDTGVDLNLTIGNGTINFTTKNAKENIEEDFEFHGFFNSLLISPPYPRFRWTKKTQDMMISAFFWGYMILQIPSGQLAHRFGARSLLLGAMAANCFFALLFPIAAYYGGWICAFICRIGQGLTQACIVPSIHTMLGKWSPLEERGRMAAIIHGGQALGTVLGLPITGFLSSSSLGWPGIFRFYGLLSGLTAVFIWYFMADSPSQHRTISSAERHYIEEALGQLGPKKKLPVPWKKILTHPGMLAIIAAHIGQTWAQLVLYSEVPAYMDNVMGVNIKANGLLTALPFLLMFFSNFFFSWVADMIIVKKYMTVTNARKLANSMGALPAAIGLFALGYAPKDIYIVETILILVCVFKVSTHSGFYVNHIDISPNYAGTMMSISNFVSNLVGSQAPIIAGAILTDVTDASLWRIVFFITCGLYLVSNMIYVIFGTANLADWNDPPQYDTVALSENEAYKKSNEQNGKEDKDTV